MSREMSRQVDEIGKETRIMDVSRISTCSIAVIE